MSATVAHRAVRINDIDISELRVRFGRAAERLRRRAACPANRSQDDEFEPIAIGAAA